jgi:hypothetical protein
MQHSTHAPTQSEDQRFAEFHDIGCVVSFVYLRTPEFEFDVHHIVRGKKRLGHLYTIPLSLWFHRGDPPNHLTIEQASARLGPSLARNKKAFVERFGTEFELLEMVNALIDRKRSLAPRMSRQAKPNVQPIVPREWTICGAIAVKTRSLKIAQRVAEQTTAAVSGTVDGYEFLSLDEYMSRSA